MITQIVIHLFPHEIDSFDWQSHQFKIGSNYLSSEDKIIIDVTLDLNFVDWNKSILPKKFFIDKFYNIQKLWDWCETIFTIDEEGKCRGCDDKRRNSIRTSISDNILYLDNDIIFPVETLKYIIDASKIVDKKYYIISAQIVRLWDTTWDVLTNKKYLSEPSNGQIYNSSNPYRILYPSDEQIELLPINEFKFAGGWFNLLSTKLLKLIDIPDSFGPYGIDDLYVMICCKILKKKGCSIQQYVLNNIVVTEDIKYKSNLYKNYLFSEDLKIIFREHAEKNMNGEIENFIKRIENYGNI